MSIRFARENGIPGVRIDGRLGDIAEVVIAAAGVIWEWRFEVLLLAGMVGLAFFWEVIR